MNGSATVLSGGNLTPAIGSAGFATTTFGGSLSLNSTSNANFNLSGAPDGSAFVTPTLSGDNDHIVLTNVGSNLALNGLIDISGSPNAGYYELFSYAGTLSGAPILGSHPAGDNFSFDTSTYPGQVDLVVTTASGSATWISTNNSTYLTGGNWSPATAPNGATQVATFGTGSEATVTISTPVILGQLHFDNPSTGYMLGGGGSLTLDNSGGGASVNVDSGTKTPIISTTMILADTSKSTTFNIASGASLEVSGSINESATVTGQQITLAGGGTLELDGTNGYTGGTTVNNGTLTVGLNNPVATLGSGPLAIGGSGIVNVASTSLTVGGLSGAVGSQLNIGDSATLAVNQTGTGTFSGTLALGNSPSGTSGLTVNTGTLKLSVAGSTVQPGATATVASGATLQLAGSVSALSNSDGSNGANVNTTGTAALLVTGTNQTVGIVSSVAGSNGGATVYAGNTTVGDGTNAANLTATQILQNTLTINAGSTVTIAPSGSGIMTVATAGASSASAAAGSSAADSAAAMHSRPSKTRSRRARSAVRRASGWRIALPRSSGWRQPIRAWT